MGLFKRLSTRAFLLAGSALMAPGAANAADTIVTNGSTIGLVSVSGTDTVTVNAGGAISTTGSQQGVLWGGNSTGAGVSVTNNGTITAAGAIAAIGTPTPRTGPFAISNTGAITSVGGIAIVLGNGPVTITNSGTIAGLGPQGFAIAIGTGADTLNLTTSSVITGRVNLGTGSALDTLNLSGAGSATFRGESNGGFVGWDGVDNVNVNSGVWTLLGGGYYENVTVASGATMIVEDSGREGAVDGGIGPGRITGNVVVTVNGTLNVPGSRPGPFANAIYATPDTPGGQVFAGNGTVNILGAGTASVTGTSNTFTGNFNIANAGRLILTGNMPGNVNLGTNGVFVLGGSFAPNGQDEGGLDIYRLTGCGNYGSLTGNLNIGAGGFGVFNRCDSYSYNGTISGSGSLIKNGPGVLTLGGSYNYTGRTTINGGSIVVTSLLPATTVIETTSGASLTLNGGQQTVAGLSGDTGSVNTNGGTLTVASAEANTYGGALTGAGSVVVSGGGALNLTGASTYTGATTVQQGLLSVNGSIVSSVTVNNGGVLGGAGTITAPVTIATGGVVSPGNSPGTLNVAGNFTFASGSKYTAEVLPSGVGDLIAVTGGSATIQSNVGVDVQASAGNWNSETNFTILTATGGVNGTFGSVTSNLAFLDPSLVYSANAVQLRLRRNATLFTSVAATDNQRAVALAVNNLSSGGAVFNTVLGQSAAGARASFDSVSGEVYASAAAAGLNNAQAVFDLTRTRLAQPDGGGSVWGQAGSSSGDLDGDASASKYEYDRSSVAVGAERTVGAARLGVALNYATIDGKAKPRSSFADVDSTDIVVYGGASLAGFKLRAAGSYSWRSTEVDRYVAVGALTDRTTGSYDGNAAAGEIEVARPISVGKAGVLEPFVSLSYADQSADAFTEKGGAMALAVQESEQNATTAIAGLHASHGFGPADRQSRLFGTVAWKHAGGDLASRSDASFASTPAAAFSVTGAALAENSALVELGADLKLSSSATLTAAYRGDLAENASESAFRARLSFNF